VVADSETGFFLCRASMDFRADVKAEAATPVGVMLFVVGTGFLVVDLRDRLVGPYLLAATVDTMVPTTFSWMPPITRLSRVHGYRDRASSRGMRSPLQISP
jgi:hypothetical protein